MVPKYAFCCLTRFGQRIEGPFLDWKASLLFILLAAFHSHVPLGQRFPFFPHLCQACQQHFKFAQIPFFLHLTGKNLPSNIYPYPYMSIYIARSVTSLQICGNNWMIQSRMILPDLLEICSVHIVLCVTYYITGLSVFQNDSAFCVDPCDSKAQPEWYRPQLWLACLK